MFAAAHMAAHLTFTGASPERIARFWRSLVRSVGGRLA